MAYYIVRFDGKVYANNELYYTAISGGERAFMKALANKTVIGKKLLDQTLFPLTETQQRICRNYNPTIQDFDDFYKHLNIVKDNATLAVSNAAIIPVPTQLISETFKYRHINFFSARDYKESKKYRMLAKLAATKICGSVYIALDAVDARVERPIVITLKK